jgi:L-seryl-tRNA(Ser) seleniumtransferase
MTRTYNGDALGNVSPHYTWTWDADKVKITNQEVMQKLGETQPVAIGAPPGHGMGSGGMSGRPDPNWTGPYDAAGGGPAPGGARAGRPGAAPGAAAAGAPGGAAAGGRGGRGGAPNTFGFSTWLLKEGEDKYIANRLVEIFSAAVAPGAFPASGSKAAAKKS